MLRITLVVLQANNCVGGAVLLRGVDLAGAAQQDGPQLSKSALSALRLVDPARRRRGVHLAPLAAEAMARRTISLFQFNPVADHTDFSNGGCRRPALTSALPSISLEFDLDKARQILPLAVIYILMMATNNLCLHYVQVSFYQVLPPLEPTTAAPLGSDTFFFSDCSISHYTLLHRLHFHLPANRDISHGSLLPLHRPLMRWRVDDHLIVWCGLQACLACVVVMAGFALGSLGEAQFSCLGLAYGLVSSIFVALYGIFVKRASPVVDNDSW